jgi:hypothetical protein
MFLMSVECCLRIEQELKTNYLTFFFKEERECRKFKAIFTVKFEKAMRKILSCRVYWAANLSGARSRLK